MGVNNSGGVCLSDGERWKDRMEADPFYFLIFPSER